jgi:hypothetical protein
MGVYRFVANLSCTRLSRDGRNIPAEDFVTDLSLSDDDPIEGVYSNEGAWATSRVAFRLVHLYDFEDAEEPSESFGAAVDARLLDIAAFLDRQPASVFLSSVNAALKFMSTWKSSWIRIRCN